MKTSEREASKNHLTERRSVRTAVATISYLEDGPSDGSPVFFLHGFPDDPTGFDKVVDRISNHGLHLIRPFLRGFGPTEVNSPTALGNSRPKNCKRSCLLSATLCLRRRL